jgi:hypothetical protein
MIWAAIWRGVCSELVIMERDELAYKGANTTNTFLECFEKVLIPIYEPGIIFQQDNANIHTSHAAQEWFESHGVWVLDWPHILQIKPYRALLKPPRKAPSEALPGLLQVEEVRSTGETVRVS